MALRKSSGIVFGSSPLRTAGSTNAMQGLKFRNVSNLPSQFGRSTKKPVGGSVYSRRSIIRT